jgi:hypothetical protein
MQNPIVPRLAISLYLASCMLAVCASLTHAQQPKKRAVANVPFDFFVGSRQLPAGHYQISMTSSSVFVLNNLDNKTNAQMFTLPEGPPVEPKDSKLIFFLHDGKYVLAGLAGPTGKERLSMYLGMTAGKKDVREEVPVEFQPAPE